MILVADVGNSSTHFGLLDGEEVVERWSISTIQRTTDECGALVLQLLGMRGHSAADVDGVMISSVVPSVLYSLEKACHRYLEVEPLVVGRKLKTGLKLRTDNPREVGSDRIVNAVAALHLYGGPVVVVDFGTAITVDCVNEKGEYVGGAIAPGFRISEEALFARTAKLPRVELGRPERAIGTNTIAAMQSGLFWGYVGLVDGLVSRCVTELDDRARVVATGGMAELIGGAASTVQEIEPDLTLLGLGLLFSRNA
ncbi:MAG: type III pantothenate kinase [Deltaproteobacteria bacterium]|nr:MAG: type III pantothenate kinase [Deltaproteobacteria bacterium]